MKTYTGYTRTIRFARIGLHTTVPDMTVSQYVSATGHLIGDLKSDVRHYAKQYLATELPLVVDAHPDQPTGTVREGTANGPVVAEFTVHLADEELPAPEVDLSDITAVVEVAVRDPKRVLSIARCRTGAVVRVHSDLTCKAADVLTATGYTVRNVGGVLLVSLDRADAQS